MSKNEENLAILKDKQGRDVALKGVIVRARLHGLMADVEVEQLYQNPHNTNIEAVYTFPLPIGAVLLGLDVEIAGKKLSGQVVEKKQAERNYEDAVTDGNSAVMLEEAGPGLFTASIGNLMANESAVIRYRYGLLLSWQGSHLRFLLPTTIAPRYGDAEAAGLRPHQVPVASLDVEYPLDLAVTIEGDLASATIASLSHPISVGRSDNGVVVRLSGKAVLDRDFVLTLDSGNAQSSCVQVPDREGQVALASLRIPPVPGAENQPLALKMVIDCSGSMGGTSIAQARKAALEILNQLCPQDCFNVTLFGSEFTHVFPKLVPASAKHIAEAWNRLDGLDADMGGTEMEEALDAVFSLGGIEGKASVLLITDGEIQEHVKLVQRAGQSGHRVFVVGVGTAVAETFLQSLAKTTGGACELVAPQEGMAERVLSQFHRMRQPKLGELHIEWPAGTDWQTALPETVFAGDTVHVFAGFGRSISGNVKLAIKGASDVMTTISSATEPNIPRIAAARRIETATEKQGLELSLAYQLLSKWTNYLVVAEREVKAGDLPELHQVPQMLAAGWGGVGHVSGSLRAGRGANPAVFGSISFCESLEPAGCSFNDFEDDIPFGSDSAPRMSIALEAAPLFNRSFDSVERKAKHSTPAEFIEQMESELANVLRIPKLAITIQELNGWGLNYVVAGDLRRCVREGYAEPTVVAAFAYALTQSALGDRFSRNLKRVILKEWKDAAPENKLNGSMLILTNHIDATSWGQIPTMTASPDPETGSVVIKVIGVGGAGGNGLERMIQEQIGGVEFICCNTDALALKQSSAQVKLQLGNGLSAGGDPEKAEELALAERDQIAGILQGAHMVLIVAGMGGGTGTGVSPIIAEVAQEMGILTVAVVTKPFEYEGKRKRLAEEGVAKLARHVDSLIVILNEKLEEMLGEEVSMREAFQAADNVMRNAVGGIAEIINVPGLVNVDFEDVRTVMGEMGKAMMGSAVAAGVDRARIAAEGAVTSPLLGGIELSGARGVLVSITASNTLGLKEYKEVMNTIRQYTAPEATVICGAVFDEAMEGQLRVTVVATGLGGVVVRKARFAKCYG
jgi:cell division protein FtsZ